MEKPRLIYHTFLQEFSGSSAEEIIRAVYDDAKAGFEDTPGGLSYEAWWDHQRASWKEIYNLAVPAHDAENACQELLAILLQVGALKDGPKRAPRVAEGVMDR